MAHPVPLLSTLAVAAAALALGAPAPASDTQGWEVSMAGKTCMMLSTFEDDVSVGLIWIGPDGHVAFMAAGDSMGRVAGKPGTTISLNAKFDGDVPHDDWTDDRAKVITVGPHQVAVIADWGPSLSKELTTTVGSSATVSIRVGGQALGSYNLAGSKAASAELERCGAQIAAK